MYYWSVKILVLFVAAVVSNLYRENIAMGKVFKNRKQLDLLHNSFSQIWQPFWKSVNISLLIANWKAFFMIVHGKLRLNF